MLLELKETNKVRAFHAYSEAVENVFVYIFLIICLIFYNLRTNCPSKFLAVVNSYEFMQSHQARYIFSWG